MFDEMDQQLNNVSFLIQEMSNNHIDNEFMNFGLCYCEQSFNEIFNEELMFHEEINIHFL